MESRNQNGFAFLTHLHILAIDPSLIFIANSMKYDELYFKFRSSVFKSVKHFDHSFAFDAPKIWNELPHDVRSATSVASFRKKLKTYLFAKAYPP